MTLPWTRACCASCWAPAGEVNSSEKKKTSTKLSENPSDWFSDIRASGETLESVTAVQSLCQKWWQHLPESLKNRSRQSCSCSCQTNYILCITMFNFNT